MPSTYDSLLRLERQATGENENTWGEKANNNFDMLAEAIAGHVSVAITGSGDYSLSTANAASDEARRSFLTLSGTLVGDRTIICPATSKLYVIRRNTTGDYAITMKPTAGTAVTLPSSGVFFVACDGVACHLITNPDVLDTTTGGTISGPIVVSVSSSVSTHAAVRIQQTGTGHALMVEDAAADTSPFVINSNGVHITGTTVAYSLSGFLNQQHQIHGTSYTAGPLYMTWSATGIGPTVQLAKSRGATVGTAGAVELDDLLGRVYFAGDSGSGVLMPAGGIAVVVDASVSASVVPGRLVFQTADSAGVLNNAACFDKDGNFGIGTQNPQARLHIANGNIQFVNAVASAPSGSPPLFMARAYALVDNNGSIYKAGNVSAITKNSTGDFTITFNTAMPDTAYAPIVWSSNNTGFNFSVSRLESGLSTTSFRVQFVGHDGSNFTDMDPLLWSFVVFC